MTRPRPGDLLFPGEYLRLHDLTAPVLVIDFNEETKRYTLMFDSGLINTSVALSSIEVLFEPIKRERDE